MIQTPSLRGRLTLISITLLTVLIGTLDTFVFLSLRDRLEESLVEILDAREQIARRLPSDLAASELADLLADAGVPAVVRDADGNIHLSDPPDRSFGLVPPGAADEGGDVERRLVRLENGFTVEVQVARGGIDRTLQRLLLLEIVGTVALLLLALVILRRVAALITRPVEQIVRVADAIAQGQTDRRLEPSDPSTELGRLAVAFDRTVDALETALSEARMAQVSSRRFLSDAAHQLRTPLAGLRASAESLLRNPEGEGHEVLVANIAREAVRAGRLVDDLLKVARMDSGEKLTFEQLDLLEVVRQERDRAVALAPSLAITLTPTGRDFTVTGDRRALQDAVANLLDNARAHAKGAITVDLHEDLGALTLVVEDDGEGIPEGEEERAFERFVSLVGDGSGLGLAIARGSARSHGGELRARGSRFELWIPRTNV